MTDNTPPAQLPKTQPDTAGHHEKTLMTLIKELIAFGRRGNAEVIFDQDANELVFLCNAWDRDGYGYHLWEENGLWSVGRSSRYRNFKNPSTDLSTPDFDIALRWLIHKVGSTARTELRMHPLKVPVNGGIHNEHIAPGWRYEYVNGNYVDLYTPQGQLLPVTMTDSPPTVATDAVKLSHLMGFTPQQLLASYQDPYGRPHLTRYLQKTRPTSTLTSHHYPPPSHQQTPSKNSPSSHAEAEPPSQHIQTPTKLSSPTETSTATTSGTTTTNGTTAQALGAILIVTTHPSPAPRSYPLPTAT